MDASHNLFVILYWKNEMNENFMASRLIFPKFNNFHLKKEAANFEASEILDI